MRVLHYGQNSFCSHDAFLLLVVSGFGGVLLTWRLAREVTSIHLGSQSPSATHVNNELWGFLIQMSCTWQDMQKTHFSQIQVVWESRWVTERWHNLGNGDLAFRLVHFKTSLTGYIAERKYCCVKYAVKWKKNTKLEAQVTFLLLYQDVRSNKRILTFTCKSPFKGNEEYRFFWWEVYWSGVFLSIFKPDLAL